MKKSLKFFLISLFLPISFFYTHAGNIARIISLGPTLTEQIYLLGEGNKIVGDTTYCIYPEAAKKKTKVGNVININTEIIIALKPDIILVTDMTDLKQLQTLKKLGFGKKIIKFSEPASYKDICNQLLKLGKIVGKKTEALNIVEKSEEKVKKITQDVEKFPKRKVFVQIGSNPLFAATGGTFINSLIKFAGGINIAEQKSSGIYSREKVVEEKPAVIIISNMGNDTQETAKQEWGKFMSIPAVKNKEVYLVDSYSLCSPNPETFPKVLLEIAKMIHPNLKVKQ